MSFSSIRVILSAYPSSNLWLIILWDILVHTFVLNSRKFHWYINTMLSFLYFFFNHLLSICYSPRPITATYLIWRYYLCSGRGVSALMSSQIMANDINTNMSTGSPTAWLCLVERAFAPLFLTSVPALHKSEVTVWPRFSSYSTADILTRSSWHLHTSAQHRVC